MEKFFKYQNSLLKEAQFFVYEMEIYQIQKGFWCLTDKTYIKSDKLIENLKEVNWYYFKDYQLAKYTELIAAPAKWLNDNAEIIHIESAKEKRAKIKQQKIEKNEKK